MWAGIKRKLPGIGTQSVRVQVSTPEEAEKKRKHRLETIELAFEPGPHELRGEREHDFELLVAELHRQFDLRWQADAVVDTKSGIILGFTMLILVQIALSVGLIGTMISRSLEITTIFSTGYAFIFSSFVVGMTSFWIRKYKLGSSAHFDMFTDWWEKKERSYSMEIFTDMSEAYEYNRTVSEKKIRYLRWMLGLFLVGLFFILISTIMLEVV